MATSTQRSGEELEYAAGFPDMFGKYVLLRPMARGGMGELFLAAAGETGGFEKLCVVKKVLHSLADAAVHRRFLDEAKVVVRLNHANLVQVFDAGKVDDEYYLAMELVEGKDLRAVWNRCAQLHRRIPVDVAMFVMREVLRGLDYVHDAMELNLVHRDISPPNILVGYRGDVKLTDFGLAKSAIKREMTSPGVVFGRYSYLSPEQAKGLPADRRTDIYACAIVLWELLTGRQLFPSANRSHQEALAAVREPKVRPPSAVVPGVPGGMDEVVLRGLAASPAERYETAGQFRDGLSDILARDFPKCTADRVAEFMGDIFAREIRVEQRDYMSFTSEDFTDLREQHQGSDLISISDIRRNGEAMELGDSDIVELDAPARSWDEGQPDLKSLEKAAQGWVGQLVGKRYRIDALIGIGGVGAIFRCTHLALGKTFALKFLHSVYTRDADVIGRFMREARAAKETGHPNIVDVIDIGSTEEGNNVYFVMELLEGPNVGEVVRGEGPLAVRRGVHIARQICRALSAAHDVGIIHRDLKSENVVLTQRGKDPDFVKVLDFGICKQVTDESGKQTPGLIMGSPEYMAPEQGAGLEATVAADVYSVGCIMFEMLTGHLPFTGRNPVDVLMQKGARAAPRVTEYRPEVPVAISDVVARCLERHPGDRPPSMRALEYELTRALDGRANAVAAVLGLGDEGDDDPGPSASASLSMQRAAVASIGDGVRPPRPRQEKTQVAPPPVTVNRSPSPLPYGVGEPRRGSGAGKALLFVLLGGVLATAVVLAVSPELITGLLPDNTLPEPHVEPPVDTPVEGKSSMPAPPSEPSPRGAVADDKSGEATAPTPVEPQPEPGSAEDEAGGAEGAEAPPEPVEPELMPDKLEKPRSAEALVAMATEALENQRFREPYDSSMVKALNELRVVDPGNENLIKLRNEAAKVLEPSAERAVKNKDWALATKNYRELLDIWPDHPTAKEKLVDTLHSQSVRLRKDGDYDKALAVADELLNYNPKDFRAMLLRGDMLYVLSRWEDAKVAYGKAKKMRPGSKHARSRYAKSARRARRADP